MEEISGFMWREKFGEFITYGLVLGQGGAFFERVKLSDLLNNGRNLGEDCYMVNRQILGWGGQFGRNSDYVGRVR